MAKLNSISAKDISNAVKTAVKNNRTLNGAVDASAPILSEAAGPDWTGVGDAAVAFDPICSQGPYNALPSARVAAGLLLSGSHADPDRRELHSAAIAATFDWSEAGRSRVYQKLTGLAAVPPAAQFSIAAIHRGA